MVNFGIGRDDTLWLGWDDHYEISDKIEPMSKDEQTISLGKLSGEYAEAQRSLSAIYGELNRACGDYRNISESIKILIDPEPTTYRDLIEEPDEILSYEDVKRLRREFLDAKKEVSNLGRRMNDAGVDVPR